MKAGVSTFFASVIAVVLVTTAFGQIPRLSADIPFDFNVGDVKMSSGRYTVKALSATTLLVKSTDSGKWVVSLSDAATTPTDLKSAQLVFTQYGDRVFLSAVDWARGLSRELPRTKLEIQAERNARTRQRFQVSAR